MIQVIVMVQRKGLDWDNLEIIDEEEVPSSTIRKTKYAKLFNMIERGKTLVLTDDQVSLTTARATLRNFHKKGRFKNLVATQRTINGVTKLYITNPKTGNPES